MSSNIKTIPSKVYYRKLLTKYEFYVEGECEELDKSLSTNIHFNNLEEIKRFFNKYGYKLYRSDYNDLDDVIMLFFGKL